MSFLDKFKGKTTQITKAGVSNILGSSPNNPETPLTKNVNHSFTIDLPDIRRQKKNKASCNEQEQQSKKKLQRINPFSVSNPFFLDEQERERTEKMRKEKEIKERIERQRKKRKEIQERMAKFDQVNKEKFNSKQWIRLGGLGPNLGGQEWTKKKQLQSKMMKFAQEIKQINLQKVKRVPYMSYSGLRKQGEKDSRTKALEYSRTVPRPALMKGGELSALIIPSLPKSQSREELNELELLEQNHLKYMNLIKRI